MSVLVPAWTENEDRENENVSARNWQMPIAPKAVSDEPMGMYAAVLFCSQYEHVG
jgi:hypothetical protein